MNHSVKYRYKPNTFWKSLFSILILLGWQQGNGQCYAKCVIPAKYKKLNVSLPIFIGDINKVNSKYLDNVSKQLYPNEAPISSNKNNKRQSKITELIIVKDTNMIKTFELRNYEIIELIEKEKIDKLRPVLCKEDLTPTLIQLIKTSLHRLGFYSGPINSNMDLGFHQSLAIFKQKQGLPRGIIDFETLDALNISYKGAF